MKHWTLVIVLCVTASQCLSAQRRARDADPDFEPRLAKLEAEREGLREDMRNATAEIEKLRTSLKEVRDKATSAEKDAATANDDIGEIKWIGRGIMGAFAFLIGVVVTQWVTKFMNMRKPRLVNPA
jgi:ElaB/YqjD/DUF883 family membrane-anchored ribosome-binding protein